MPRARVLKSRAIYTGPVFGVRQDHVIEPGGIRVVRDVVTHHGSVVLLPVLADRRILLVRQYRHAVGQFLWELVAGRIELGEPPLTAARRFRKLLDVFPTPGFVSERMVVFAATGLTAGRARPESDERITSRAFTLRQLERMIRRGTLRDAKSIASLLYYSRFFRSRS